MLVHPPGGIVGGDTLAIEIELEPGAHALVTTPGATRFYRSLGEPATQTLAVRAAAGSRLEWLPLETLAYSGCIAENRARFALAPGAEMIGWDLTALGLPASDQPFVAGRFTQSIELAGPLARARHGPRRRRPRCSTRRSAGPGSAPWRRSGSPPARRSRPTAASRLLDAARAACDAHPLGRRSGATAVDPGVIVVRVLAPRVEPAMALLAAIWRAWRPLAWQLEASPPRVWRT